MDLLPSQFPASVDVIVASPSLQELVVALSHLVVQYESNFCTVALQFMEEEKNYPLPSPAATGTAASASLGPPSWPSAEPSGAWGPPGLSMAF